MPQLRILVPAALVLLVSGAPCGAQTLTLPPDGGNQRAEVIQQIGLLEAVA